MRCEWTKKPCDPESYVCHYFGRTFERTQNKTCKDLIPDGEEEEDE